MILAQQMGRQHLERRPEPAAVTDAEDNVLEYDRVMTTKLVLAYAAGIECIHRARPDGPADQALDLACGPGHFTLSLARYLGYGQVTGVDLSGPMVESAAANARRLGMAEQTRFRTGDATRLDCFDDATFDLACCTDAAHHLPDLETVRMVLSEMSRVTGPSGLVMLMDLARLRTARLTERYIEVLGADYRDRGLSCFLEDFRNSMYAAWTPAELATAIPRETGRAWWHIVPRGLPSMQFLLGVPEEARGVFARKGFSAMEHPLVKEWTRRWTEMVGSDWTKENVQDWKVLRLTLLGARHRRLS